MVYLLMLQKINSFLKVTYLFYILMQMMQLNNKIQTCACFVYMCVGMFVFELF